MQCFRFCLARVALPIVSLFALTAASSMALHPSSRPAAPQRTPGAAALGGSTAAPATSTTTLTLTSAGNPATSIKAGAPITLTAQVTSTTTHEAASPGQVKFCNAAAAHCEDAALLGIAQLTSAGTATYRFTPGPGSHTFRAVFVGTKAFAGSQSAPAALTVTHGGAAASTTNTTLASSGSPGDYTLTASVAGLGIQPPTGNVTFPDTTYRNLSLGSAPLVAGPPSLSFADLQDLPVASGPNAPGDFNGDGLLDLAAVVNGSLTIEFNNGGTLVPAAATYPVGLSSSAIVVADFNSDGFADLAIADRSGSVTILLGSASGAFSYAPPAVLGGGANDMAAADFNRDGIVDLAVADSNDGNISIALGKGDGTFAAATTVPGPGAEAVFVKVADFNNDGNADLAFPSAIGSVLSIFLGNGDGTFTLGSGVHTGGGSVLIGDFNGDGNADLAVGGSGKLTVLLGHGNGTFYTRSTLYNVFSPELFSTADINNDGITDLVVFLGYPATLLGNGDGTFTAGPSYDTGSLENYTDLAAVGDFNGDGLPDLVTVTDIPVSGGPNILRQSLLADQATQTATATLTHAATPVGGTQLVQASYPGDADFLPSSSSTLLLVGSQPATTLTLSSTPNPSVYGSPVTLTAVLSPYATSGGTTNGESITFYQNGAVLGTGALSSGIATLKYALLPVGSTPLTASFASDAILTGSASNTAVQKVTPASGPPPTFVVTVNTDPATGNPSNCTGAGSLNCSLRDAIAAATAADSGNITFSPTVFATSQPPTARTINLQAVLIPSSNTTITAPTTGAGATLTQLITLTPTNDTAFEIEKGTVNVVISGLAISSGDIPFAPGEGALAVYSDGALTLADSAITGNTSGGETRGEPAVYNDADATLTLTNSTISGNSDFADPDGGGFGGGIYNAGTLVVTGSTISDNSAEDADGAGLLNDGTATLTNTTISGNQIFFYNDGGSGGGIANAGTLTLINSTVTGNSASLPGDGSGIYNAGTLHLTNTSITGNLTNYNETYDYRTYSPVEDDCDGPGCPPEHLPAAPVFTPPSGTYANNPNASITDTTSGALIFYTTDGSTPTPLDAEVFHPGDSLPAQGTLKAVAYLNGLSPVATATYTTATAACTLIDYSAGFTSGALTLNGGTTVKSGLLQLTDGGFNEARSAFYSTPVPTTEFTTDFQFQLQHPLADGITFTIQSAGPTALGASGGGLGYAGIPKSVALKFDLFNDDGEGFDSTGYYLDGAYPGTPALNLSQYGLNLHSGHIFAVHISYNAAVTTSTLTDLTTYQSYSASSPGDLTKLVGNTAYVGFTGATGLLTATQNILSWTYGGGPGCGTSTAP